MLSFLIILLITILILLLFFVRIRNEIQKKLLVSHHRLMIQCCKELIKHKAAKAVDYYELAAAHYNLGEYEEAIKNYDILNEFDPKYQELNIYDLTLLKKINELKESSGNKLSKSYDRIA